MKRLIVNADDFGLHREINRGIIQGHREGFITSTSLMCSAPAWEDAVALAQDCPDLGIGVHLTLVGGVKPCLPRQQVSSLLDANGLFPQDYVAFAKAYYSGGIRAAELEAELRAQLETALSTGLNITHVDSHQHTHVLPGVASLVQRLMGEYGLTRLRIPQEACNFTGGFTAGLGRKIGRSGLSFCAWMAAQGAKSRGLQYPQHFFGMLAGGNLNPQLVGNIIRALPQGTSELMTHPGLNNAVLGQCFSWHYHWEQELAAYLDAGNKQLLQEQGVQLINFGGLDHE